MEKSKKFVEDMFRSAFTVEEHKVDKISFFLGAQYLMDHLNILEDKSDAEKEENLLQIEEELDDFYQSWQR